MDGNDSYPLIDRPTVPGELVPVSSAIVVEVDSCDDSESDPRAAYAWLWERFRKLGVLFFIALAVARRLKLQVTELRQQANFWKAQHGRAVVREAELVERVQVLQGEIREMKRRSSSLSVNAQNLKPKPGERNHCP